MILCSLFQDIPEGPEKDQYPGKYKAADEDPGGPGQSTQIGLSRGLGLHLIQMVKAGHIVKKTVHVLSLIHIWKVASVNNLEWPAEDFCGTHLELGQEIYYDPEEPKKLYVKYDSGFALFEAEEYDAEGQKEAIDPEEPREPGMDLGEAEAADAVRFGRPKEVLDNIPLVSNAEVIKTEMFIRDRL